MNKWKWAGLASLASVLARLGFVQAATRHRVGQLEAELERFYLRQDEYFGSVFVSRVKSFDPGGNLRAVTVIVVGNGRRIEVERKGSQKPCLFVHINSEKDPSIKIEVLSGSLMNSVSFKQDHEAVALAAEHFEKLLARCFSQAA